MVAALTELQAQVAILVLVAQGIKREQGAEFRGKTARECVVAQDWFAAAGSVAGAIAQD
jgi:hypothetical protein